MPTQLISGKKLHYIEKGTGFPIIFGHSYFWDATMWAPQLEALSDEYRCISIDLWDHGQSDSLPATPYSIEQITEDVWQFIQALKINSCAVVGLSVGGMWAAHLALQHPETVKALVMMDTYMGSEPEETRQEYFGLIDILAELGEITPEFADRIIPYFFSPHTFQNKPDIVNAFRNDLMARDPDKVPGICELGRAIFNRRSLLKELPNIKQPTLVMVGEDDVPRPPKEAKEMVDLIPGATLKIIKQAGHIANLENPKETNDQLQKFLNVSILSVIDS